MAKEMKTLNSYEVVDQAVRDRVTTLENNSTSIKVDTYLSSYSTNPLQTKVIYNKFKAISNIYFPGYSTKTVYDDDWIQVYSETNSGNFSFIVMAYDTKYPDNAYLGIVLSTENPEPTVNTVDIIGTRSNFITSIETGSAFTSPTANPLKCVNITPKGTYISVTILGAYSSASSKF